MLTSNSITDPLSQAMQLHRAGDVGGAAAMYRQIVDRDPANADAWHLLGVIARQTGKNELALQLLETALQHQPDHAPALANHALLLREAGDLVAARRQAEAAIRADARHASAYEVLGGICQAERNFAEALIHFRRALALQPGQAGLYNAIAAAEQRLGNLDAAKIAITEALRLAPDNALFYNTHGNIERAAGNPQKACESFAEAVRRDPSLTDAVTNEALTRLLIGDYARGWALFAARGRTEARYQALTPWEGGPVQRGRVLLIAEQGLGDSLQFIRLASLAAARAGKIAIEVQAPLHKLAALTFPCAPIITPEDALPEDVTHYCRMMDLAPLLCPDLNQPPGVFPWLTAEAKPIPSILDGVKTPRIGLTWAGNPGHLNDAKRSLRLAQLGPALAPFAAHVVSLQKGPQAEELKQSEWVLRDAGPVLEDFAATASLLRHIDLLITVDTSVAHLAGALGRPVWIMLPFDPDWRWQMARRDVPWYPTAKLYRQGEPGDWKSVTAAIARDLEAFIVQGDKGILKPPVAAR